MKVTEEKGSGILDKDKSKFILNILDYSLKKKVDDKTKERLIYLIGKEIEKTGDIGDEILKRLEILENLIKNNPNLNKGVDKGLEKNKINKSQRKQPRTKHHNPKKILEWLRLFTVNNTAIKFSTHLWDQNDLFKDYENFISLLNDEFQKYNFKEMVDFNSNLYWNKVYPFLFQKKLTSIQKEGESTFGWGKHKIKIGWQYPDVIAEWNKLNPGKSPFTMELPDDLKPDKPIRGKTVKYFEDVVNLFKKEIEFRDNDLYIEIKAAIAEIIPNHRIEEEKLQSLRGVSFYTNTEYVVKAISRILQMIKSKSSSTDVSISCTFDSEQKEYALEILHHQSFSDRPKNDPKVLLKGDSGDMGILRTTLTSLCDFSIESRFKNEKRESKFYRIDYLYDGIEEKDWQPEIYEIDNMEGFKFILKFPTI
jgi:histidine kinase-like protein